PPASLRKLKAAPVLCSRVQLKNEVTSMGLAYSSNAVAKDLLIWSRTIISTAKTYHNSTVRTVPSLVFSVTMLFSKSVPFVLVSTIRQNVSLHPGHPHCRHSGHTTRDDRHGYPRRRENASSARTWVVP